MLNMLNRIVDTGMEFWMVGHFVPVLLSSVVEHDRGRLACTERSDGMRNGSQRSLHHALLNNICACSVFQIAVLIKTEVPYCTICVNNDFAIVIALY